ncbi:hypothetical protein ACA910_002945 [Epithemia clementina (nom. ined.)]
MPTPLVRLATTPFSNKKARTTLMHSSPRSNRSDDDDDAPQVAAGPTAVAAAAASNSMVLMEPTEDRPWLVEITAALPVSLQQAATATAAARGYVPTNDSSSPPPLQQQPQPPMTNATSCVRLGRWMALVNRTTTTHNTTGSVSDGYQIHVWYTIPSQSFMDQKFSNPVLKLLHPKWSSDCPIAPLIALQSSMHQQQLATGELMSATTMTNSASAAAASSSTSVFLYVVNPSDGSLFLWKLHTSDLTLPTSTSYKSFVMLPLLLEQPQPEGGENEDDPPVAAAPAEVVTCMTASTHLPLQQQQHQLKYLLVGTSAGRVFWIRQHQNVLHVETVPYPRSHDKQNGDSESSASSSLLLNPLRWVWNTPKKPRQQQQHYTHGPQDDDTTATPHQQSPFLVQTLFLGVSGASTSSTSVVLFVTWTRFGEMVLWKAIRNTGGGNHNSSNTTTYNSAVPTQFGTVQTISLFRLVQEHPLAFLTTTNSRLLSLQVIKAAVGAVDAALHVLVRVRFMHKYSSSSQSSHQQQQQQQPHDNNDWRSEETQEQQQQQPPVMEDRLYWLRLEERQSSHLSPTQHHGSPLALSPSQRQQQQPSSEWVLTSCTWLDRFVSPLLEQNQVQVVGLQVADNGVAYAALVVSRTETKEPTKNGDNDDYEEEDYDDETEEQQPRRRQPEESWTTTTTTPILMAHDVPTKHLIDDYEYDYSSTSQQQQQQLLHEVDLHEVLVETQLISLFPDDRTFGCTVVASSGTLVRVECKEATALAQQQMHWLQDVDGSPRMRQQQRQPMSSSRKISLLLNHLRSTFWESYQYPDSVIALPPSIQNADKSDLEMAIIKLGLELQKDTLGSSSNNSNSNMVLARHLALLEFLQRAGMYRSLMPLTKWHLLAIGQEIAAYQAVVAAASASASSSPMSTSFGRMTTFLESVTPYGMALWLEGVQSAVVLQKEQEEGGGVGSGEREQEIFASWLERALSAALGFRQERCTLTYDIASNAKPPRVERSSSVPVWTSKPLMQKVLLRQLTHWKEYSGSSRSILASTNQLEVVATAALRSFRDSFLATPCETTKVGYAKMQSLAVNLLRRVSGPERDAFAWSLCKEHAYFWGLCQMAHEHRKERGTEFTLMPLFKKFDASVCDLGTDMSFGKYVIKWHIERNLFGEALHYGNTQCQDDLLMMINSEPSLRPYRWIVSMQRGDYESAATNLSDVVERGGSNLTLKQAKFNLAMSKLANKVVLQHSVQSSRPRALERAQTIENMREIAHAQEQLLDPVDAKDHSYLWSAVTLLDYAMEKVDRLKKDDKEGKAKTCFIALVLCASLENTTLEQRKNAAANVWYKAVMADWDFLTQILHGETNLTDHGIANAVLNKSVFGRLVEECDKIQLGEVGIDQMMERFIVDKLVGNRQLSDRSSMHRLLRSVLSVQK